MAVSQHKTDPYAPHFETLHYFYETFDRVHEELHLMMRAAFATDDILSKRNITDLIFLKDELVILITAAAALARHKDHKTTLEKFFRRWPAQEWLETLDLLFYAAVFDGFFYDPPNHEDIYHYCRGLHAMVRACADINETYRPA
jgi:hypothetical protein